MPRKRRRFTSAYRTRVPSRPHGRALHWHAPRAPHEECLQCQELRRAVTIAFRPHADHAIAQPPLQRSQRLPFEPIEGIAGRMSLRHGDAGKLAAPVVAVAVRAGKVELPLTALKEGTPSADDGLEARITA